MEQTNSDTTLTEANTEATPVETESNLIDIEQFFKADLRVAEILTAEAMPKSKKLLKLKVSLGSEFPERQIMAGIALHYSPESLVGQRIVIVANLKPATLMGERSEGMLLAASSEDKVVLVQPAVEIAPGSKVG
jgi:methionine--tRNA ligase beta chain